MLSSDTPDLRQLQSFVSLNSWTTPGLIYQGVHPVEVICGGSADWPRLRKTLLRYQKTSADSPHPQGAAVGYFAYDGSFSFGIFPELLTLSPDMPNAIWQTQKHHFPASPSADAAPSLQSNMTREEFLQKVLSIQDYIRAGDIYQVNLSQRFHSPWQGNPYLLFEELMARSPAPGAAFIDEGDRQILSSSPELFLKIQGRHIMTRPIKGTRPRSRDPIRDGQLAYELQTSPKELAELIMITDLERNDLGRVCEYGSVHVTDLVRLEKYPQVFHLVSTVEGHLRKEVDTLDAIAACFPGGSITGAPKKRAMEIIRELEPSPRNVYTGAIGYIAFNGDAAFNIAIRTVTIENGILHYHVGSGITIDSDPAAEYDETLHKAAGIQDALSSYGKRIDRPIPSGVYQKHNIIT